MGSITVEKKNLTAARLVDLMKRENNIPLNPPLLSPPPPLLLVLFLLILLLFFFLYEMNNLCHISPLPQCSAFLNALNQPSRELCTEIMS